MNWLALLSSAKGLISKVRLTDVLWVMILVLVVITEIEANKLEDKISAQKAEILSLSSDLKAVKEANELLSFSSTVDDVLCQQAIKDERTKVTEVNRGVARIRAAKGSLLDEALPVEVVKTLNETREGQIK